VDVFDEDCSGVAARGGDGGEGDLRRTADMADTTDAVREWARDSRLLEPSDASEVVERFRWL
jgi:hypothetical protein